MSSRDPNHSENGASDKDDRGGLSILRARSGRYATKRYSRSRTGRITKSAYGNEKWFSVTPTVVGGIFDLAALLDRIQHDPHAFVVRGALRPEADPQLTRRLLHGTVNLAPIATRSHSFQSLPEAGSA